MKSRVLGAACVFVSVVPNVSVASSILDVSYSPVFSFSEVLAELGTTNVSLTFDGTSYWTATGGDNSGTRYAQYDSSGNPLTSYAPGLDFRSVFTDDTGTVFARQYANNTIYQQSTPGVFSASGVNLTGGTLDSQSSVVLNGSGDEYVAQSNGTISRWALDGTYIGATSLIGYSAAYPASRGLVAFGTAFGTYYGTYDAGVFSLWDLSGNLLDTAVLLGSTGDFDTEFSLSYANDMLFLIDGPSDTWNGYDLAIIPVPPAVWLFGSGLLGMIGIARKKKAA